MAQDLVAGAVDRILSAIASGEFGIGEPLPAEMQLSQWLDVSRPTMRAAVRTLAERGVLEVRHGSGTYVTDPSSWTDLSTVIWWLSRTVSSAQLGAYLSQVRRMLEVGAAGLAAANRTQGDVEAMREALDSYSREVDAGDLESASLSDIRFHDLIFRASGNPFLSIIMQPLGQALLESRQQTTSFADVRSRATRHHERILRAVEDRDAEGAKAAMRAHMSQTAEDIARNLSNELP
ncbi:FadR family transcriptional regulator [Arcanobacterium haemolyticum]|nr:FadR family transcriptional regulator [Arcanobacterium haemolyticum]